MLLKQKVYNHYLQLVQDRIDIFQDMIVGLTEDSKNDAKGSAGDKHETALSMMHIEQEKLTNKLKEVLAFKNVLLKIDPLQEHIKIGLGSLVVTNHLTVFICVALTKILVDHQNVFAISPISPLGKLLMGKGKGESFVLNSTPYTIISVT